MRDTDQRPSSTPAHERRADGGGRAADGSGADGPACPGSLIVVSNRQPYRHGYEDASPESGDDAPEAESDDAVEPDETDGRSITVDEPAGGLTAGLDPVLQETSGAWIAWGDGEADFAVTDADNCVAVPPESESYTLRRVDLSDEAVDTYYYGFSNRVLWPLCHEFPDLIEDGANDFAWYRTVNELFADAVADHATEESIVWLQDYHFALAPRMIREVVPSSVTIAHFWHIPWPDPSTFRECPAGDRILEGLLGNDLLGFHVDRYVAAFLDCVEQFVPDAAVDRERGLVRHCGTTTRVVATPMGVDAESYDRDARAVDDERRSSLLERYDIPADAVVGLGVDRLDYTKGIPERLAAIERFFERNPDWHGEFTFVQSSTPSRTQVPAYERHGELVRSEVERINQRFGTDDWRPIVYTEDYVTREDLCALYRRADVMIVSALLDGMNLVTQEYVASSVDGDGVLLLSDRTGAHELLGADALTIDPTDTDGFAAQIEAALSMPASERRSRMQAMRELVFEHDLESWMETQFDWIRYVHETDGTDSDPDSDTDSRERTPPV